MPQKCLHHSLINPPILLYQQFDTPFIVATDASAEAISGVLSQIKEGMESS
jgi:hypothetical protein